MTGHRIRAVWAQLASQATRLWRDRTARYVTLLVLFFGAIGNALPFEPYDWLQKSITARLNVQPYTGDAIIIEIDSKTFEGLGRPSLDDKDLALLIRNLGEAQARRIVLGRIRQRPSSQRSSPELLKALEAVSPKAVMFTELVAKKSGTFSWTDFRPDNGGEFFDAPGVDWPTAERVQLANEISNTSPFGAPWGLSPTVRIGGRDYPSIAQIIADKPEPIFEKYDIDLRIDPRSIPTFNAIDIIKGRFDPAMVRGRQALIYSSSDVTRDAVATPFGRLPSAAPITIIAAETLRQGPPRMLDWIPAYLVAVLGILGWLILRAPLLRRSAFAIAFVFVVFSPLLLERQLIFQSTSNAAFLMILIALGRQWSKFRATLALARSAAETKSWFLAQASHDLRQPIHAIGMLAARLGQTDLNPAQADLARKIDRSIEAANRMLQSLLDLATIESGSLSPQPAPVPVNALFAELDEQVGPLAERSGVELRFVPCEATIMADRALTLAMLQNIVTNSIKYATGKRVLVGARRTGKAIALCVHDVGQGIPEADMRHVRKAFFRASSHRKGSVEGAGLGLAIVHRLATLMNLTFRLRSAPGRGTSAIIAGFVMTEFSPAPAGTTETKAIRPLAGLRVLLVDDDEVALSATAALLEQWGCIVAANDHFPEARIDTDIIVSDFDFGKGKTLASHAALVEAYAASGVPTIIVSGHQTAAINLAMRSDQYLTLTKPVRPAELRSVLMANRMHDTGSRSG